MESSSSKITMTNVHVSVTNIGPTFMTSTNKKMKTAANAENNVVTMDWTFTRGYAYF